MKATERRCDRCGKTLDHGGEARLGVVIVVQYHHPASLDICEACEAEFTLWLGRHPLFGTPLTQILNGKCWGGGYPTQEQIEAFIKKSAPEPRVPKGYKRVARGCPHHVPCAEPWGCSGDEIVRDSDPRPSLDDLGW